MTRTIWKFRLEPDITLDMPEGAQVLSAAGQGDDIMMWASVDPKADKVRRRFRVIGTGETYRDEPMTFVGTVLLAGGAMVFHVFEA